MTNYTHLSTWERDEICRMRLLDTPQTAIAKALGRSKSTISRELSRNSTATKGYRPVHGDGCYLYRRQRNCILQVNAELQQYVRERLSEGWTPEQISGRLRKGWEKLVCVSFETIYAWIYCKAMKGEKLWRYLPRGKVKRSPNRARTSRDLIKDKVHISERDEAVDAREQVGHWEADLIICKRTRPVLVFHERKTRFTFITRLANKTAAQTADAIMAILDRLIPKMRGSITFDNGTEFAKHTMLRQMLSATTYFCDAYASWQKGGVENTNGRIRRWLPRKIDLDELTDQDIQEIALTINLTPRKCLNYKSPVEAFLKELGKDIIVRFNNRVALRS